MNLRETRQTIGDALLISAGGLDGLLCAMSIELLGTGEISPLYSATQLAGAGIGMIATASALKWRDNITRIIQGNGDFSNDGESD